MAKNGRMGQKAERLPATESDADWQRRVVGRSLRTAAERSVDRGTNLIQAAATVLARGRGQDITVQDVGRRGRTVAPDALRVLRQPG